MPVVKDSKKIVWVVHDGIWGGRLHQYNSKMYQLKNATIWKLFWFKFHHRGIPICIETLQIIEPRVGSWHKVWFWGVRVLKAMYCLIIPFWKLHNIAHTDHIWLTTSNIVNGNFSFCLSSFHMDTKGGNWLCLNHLLGAHLPLVSQKKNGIFMKTPSGRTSSIATINPLSAMTESPLSNGKFRSPDLVTISLLEIWSV